MSKQRHDQGHRKRQQSTTRQHKDTTTTETLARQLVDRGLCSQHILELQYRTPKENHHKQD